LSVGGGKTGAKILEDFRWLLKFGATARTLRRSFGGNSGETVCEQLSPKFWRKETYSERSSDW